MTVVEFFAQKNGGKTPIQLLDEDVSFSPMYVCWFAEQYKIEQQLSKANVNASTLKICSGCGRLSIEPLGLNKNGEPFLGCCPDNRYITIKEYWKNSMYLH